MLNHYFRWMGGTDNRVISIVTFDLFDITSFYKKDIVMNVLTELITFNNYGNLAS